MVKLDFESVKLLTARKHVNDDSSSFILSLLLVYESPLHPVFSSTSCVHLYFLCFPLHPVFTSTSCVLLHILCSPLLLVFSSTSCVHLYFLCSPLHPVLSPLLPMFSSTSCVLLYFLCSPLHPVFTSTSCVLLYTLCSPLTQPHRCHFGSCPKCQKTCNKELKCGHSCRSPCHSEPVTIVTQQPLDALAPLSKRLPPTEKVVVEPCPPCVHLVPV